MTRARGAVAAAFGVAAATLALAAATLALAPTPAAAAVVKTWNGPAPPPGYSLTTGEALRISQATAAVRAAIEKSSLTVTVGIYQPRRWMVQFKDPKGDIAAEIHIDDRSERVVAAWSGTKANWRNARGSRALVDERDLGPATDSLWVWLPLCLLFVAPFIDPRRPLRRVHFEILLFLLFVLGHTFVVRGELSNWLLVAYPALGLLLARLLVAATGRDRSEERLVPFVPLKILAGVLFAVLAVRGVLNVVDSIPGDVAFAGVAGSDRIIDGHTLYTGGGGKYDTYGPFAYLVYVPFTLLLPFHGAADVNLVPAHAVAVTFDLLTALTLFLIGRDLRGPGRAGTTLGVVLAYAWATFPMTWDVLARNTNDNIVGALVLLAFLAFRRPVVSGALIGLAAAAKFAPLALLPVFAARTALAYGRRNALALIAIAVLVPVALIALFLPPGGLREFYDATLGFQVGRVDDPNSVWGLHSGLAGVQDLARWCAVAFAIGVALVPAKEGKRGLAALAAAVLLVLQIPLGHFAEQYIVWFLGLAFVAVFSAYELPDRDAAGTVAAAGSERAALI
ncbi:MAG: glycosyltransferase 87 family protein [Thermoleophilaceae bacterium]